MRTVRTKWRSIGVSLLFLTVSQMLFGQQFNAQTAKPSIKVALESYSFSKLFNDKIRGRGTGISLTDFIDFAAQNNFDGISLTGYFFPTYPEVPGDDLIFSIKRQSYLQGLNIVSLGVRNDFANPDPSKRALDVKHLKEWIDVAVKLGSPVVRIFSGNMPENYETRREEIAEYMSSSIKECVEYAKQKGVFVGVQNHGDFLQTADQTIDLVKRVNSDSFGIIVDSGYFLTNDPYQDMAKTMPYALNFLLKESYTINGVTTKIDLTKVNSILKKSGFQGNLAIETLAPKRSPRGEKGAAYDPFTAVPSFYLNVKNALSKRQ